MEKHLTATVYVWQESKVLLLKHPKHNKWLPPGGHVEINETPPDCARREVLEETGLQVELIREEHLWLKTEGVISCERPFMCLIENIPAHKEQPAHQHIDFIYLGYPIGGSLHPLPAEELRWFTVQEVLALPSPTEIFPDIQETIATLQNLGKVFSQQR